MSCPVVMETCAGCFKLVKDCECPDGAFETICGAEQEEVTSVPLSYSGGCEVYLVCENGHEVLVGKDSVL